MNGHEARRRAEIIQALQETRGADVVDLALWATSKVADSIVLGKREVMISGVHPLQVERLIACLGDLNFAAEEAPDQGQNTPAHLVGLTRVVLRW